MSQSYKPAPAAPFLKGLNASTDPFSQPKGSFPRGSNLLLNKRGALDVCDGSQLIHAFNGVVNAGRGKMLCVFLFSPTGAANYYLALAQALDLPLGPPQNLAASLSSGGSLVSGTTYFYKVTALDGVTGETIASNEVSATPSGGNLSVALTWNIVPNAASYNVYRSTSSGTEVLLSGTGLPVTQLGAGSLQISFTDTGFATPAPLTLASSYYTSPHSPGIGHTRIFKTTTPHGLVVGSSYTIGGVTPASPFNGTYVVTSVIDAFTVQTQDFAGFGDGRTLNGSGGTLTAGGVPGADNTQQIVLFKMPLIVGSPAQLPVSYNNSNIIAIFPALLTTFAGATGGGGGSGGGGGTGGGGNTGGGGGGRPIL